MNPVIAVLDTNSRDYIANEMLREKVSMRYAADQVCNDDDTTFAKHRLAITIFPAMVADNSASVICEDLRAEAPTLVEWVKASIRAMATELGYEIKGRAVHSLVKDIKERIDMAIALATQYVCKKDVPTTAPISICVETLIAPTPNGKGSDKLNRLLSVYSSYVSDLGEPIKEYPAVG